MKALKRLRRKRTVPKQDSNSPGAPQDQQKASMAPHDPTIEAQPYQTFNYEENFPFDPKQSERKNILELIKQVRYDHGLEYLPVVSQPGLYRDIYEEEKAKKDAEKAEDERIREQVKKEYAPPMKSQRRMREERFENIKRELNRKQSGQ